MKGIEEFVLRIDSWHTPASDYPLKRIGAAEIARRTKRRGYYRMEGVGGYMFYEVTKPVKTTELTINGETVMTDEPVNWIGMQKLAEHCYGRVLCGGLGLGLIVHALNKNEKVTEIKVAEINRDVIELVEPLLPSTNKLSVDLCDIHKFSNAQLYDTVILDMWVGKGSKDMTMEMLDAFTQFKALNPKNQVFIWGHGSETFNPAIDGKVREKIPIEYWAT